jgi:UDP-N-acetylmuramoyl-tripeptide--D-alanyl-D-alanine ligase
MLSEIAATLSSPLHGADREYSGVSTDSRNLDRDQLFVALRGPTHDGHEYVGAAEICGAAGAVVEEIQNSSLAQIAVDNTTRALGDLARAWRQRFDIPVIAVTGSNGKTTVKQMLCSIFSLAGDTHATKGNFNNEIGLPLTLLELDQRHQFSIIELGANHAGEIAYLTTVAQPDIALITNAAVAHVEGFGSIDGVAQAKGEILQGLANTGTAVINIDDEYASMWLEIAGERRIVSFGIKNPADFSARNIRASAGHVEFCLLTPDGEADVLLPVPGMHNVMNALAAAAAAHAQGQPLPIITAGLCKMGMVAGRMQRFPGRSGLQLVDDSYNANPFSFAAAIDYLASIADMNGSTWLVMGDMAELGAESAQQHVDTGQLAKRRGIDRLYCTGDVSRLAAEAFGDRAVFDADIDSLVSTINRDIDAAVDASEITILVKASRSMHLERVVDALRSDSAGKGG